ncbi:hypothetical protein K8R66_00320 [bacterium]|nr:hypothetical protein [bacterium]
MKLTKKYLKWILLIILLLVIVGYTYYDYLLKNSYQIHCDIKKKYIPCNNFSDCTQEKITEFCKSEGWSMGTKCDSHCNAKTFCLNNYCRSNSYMNTFLIPGITKFNTEINTNNKQPQKTQIPANTINECKVDTDCPANNHCKCNILYKKKSDEGGKMICKCVSKE